MLEPALYAYAFPHGLGKLVIRRESARCPSCGMSMKLWVSWPAELARPDSCLGCAGPTTPEVRP